MSILCTVMRKCRKNPYFGLSGPPRLKPDEGAIQEKLFYTGKKISVFENGCIIMEPRILSLPDTISKKTLKDMDRSIENFNLGAVSEPIDLSK